MNREINRRLRAEEQQRNKKRYRREIKRKRMKRTGT